MVFGAKIQLGGLSGSGAANHKSVNQRSRHGYPTLPHRHHQSSDLERPLHGDGEVILSARITALADEHLVTDAARFARLLGEQLLADHLRGNVSRFLGPESREMEIVAV